MLRLVWMIMLPVALPPLLIGSQFAYADSIRVEHNTLPSLRERPAIGKPSRDRMMQISVALKVPKRPELDALIEQLYNPAAPQYRHFLTRREFVNQFGPRPQAYGAVINFLRDSGLHVTATYTNRMVVDAEGTVAQVEQAFDVRINTYVAGGGRTFVANDRDPSIPAELADVVAAVAGLDDYAEMTSHAVASPIRRETHTLGVPTGYLPGQIATAYDFTPVYTSGNNGAGATLAIATAFGFNRNDVNTFWQTFGIPAPNYTVVHVGGRPPHPSLETTLDLEQTGALAPGAKILVYEAASGKFASFQSVYNRIVADNRASVVTTSWGICEQQMPRALMEGDNGIFAEAAAQGQAWFS